MFEWTGTNRPRTCHNDATHPLYDPETPHQPHHPNGACGRGVTVSQCFGGYSDRETPGPIPNPEAKPASADGTALARVWESRTPPNITSKREKRACRLETPNRDTVSPAGPHLYPHPPPANHTNPKHRRGSENGTNAVASNQPRLTAPAGDRAGRHRGLPLRGHRGMVVS